MNNILIWILLGGSFLTLLLGRIAYYVKEHKAVVVGILKTGVLAYLQDYNEIVFVGNTGSQMKPVEGDVLCLKHPMTLNLKRRRAKKTRLATKYIMLRGYEKTLDVEALRASIGEAVLMNKISANRWLGKQGKQEIFLELDGGEYKMGDTITYVPSSICFNRFYYV